MNAEPSDIFELSKEIYVRNCKPGPVAGPILAEDSIAAAEEFFKVWDRIERNWVPPKGEK